MSKPIPSIQKYMTTVPHSIGHDQTVRAAAQMMEQHDIRHLPVLKGGKLLGILSDRDIKLLESVEGVAGDELAVEEAMTDEPYAVSPDAPLDEVCGEMAEKRIGSAVVVQNHKVVGIFTTVDVCRALAELLDSRLSK
jgi:acetoin utilization protein AcuB